MPAIFRDRVAGWFKGRPGEWIDARDLERIGGRMAWRTRTSECRTQLGMTIDNRVRRVQLSNGEIVRVSEYRYRPAPARDLFDLETPRVCA